MPAIIGPVHIVGIEGGSVHFGDTFILSPKAASKTIYGSGSGNLGVIVMTNNALSASNTLDMSAVDQPIAGNA